MKMEDSEKPVIFYIDDEPQNLTVLEMSLPDDWTIYTFDNPMQALKELKEKNPSIIISDQRMPITSGVEFLEIAKTIIPYAIRIIVTGYSDEDLVVESVRKAQIFDYIRKPWDTDDLITDLLRAFDYYMAEQSNRNLLVTLKEREVELRERAEELVSLTSQLEKARLSEAELRQELECWTPPFIRWAVKSNTQFPFKKDIVGITFDIIESSKIHEIEVQGLPLRKIVLEIFSKLILKYGGWRESHSGDSAYGHFGLSDSTMNPYQSALAVAREFEFGLRNLSDLHEVEINCGIGLHLAKETRVDMHEITIATADGNLIQKSFDTTSREVDLLHRMESCVHCLPGSNIVMSETFLKGLSAPPNQLVNIGSFLFKGQDQSIELYLIPSSICNEENIQKLKEKYGQKGPSIKLAV